MRVNNAREVGIGDNRGREGQNWGRNAEFFGTRFACPSDQEGEKMGFGDASVCNKLIYQNAALLFPGIGCSNMLDEFHMAFYCLEYAVKFSRR